MSWQCYEKCILKANQHQIVLLDGADVELEGSCGPQVRASADFSTGLVRVTQLIDQITLFPERGNLVLQTVNDYCFLKHQEQIVLSKGKSYKVEFPPVNVPNAPKELGKKISKVSKRKGDFFTPLKKKFDLETSISNASNNRSPMIVTDLECSSEKPTKEFSESERDLLKGSWIDNEDIKVLYFKPSGNVCSTKCACFDMDQTIIKTQSGKTFPVNKDDWKIMYKDTIPKKLKELHNDNYRIVVFSNQRGLATGKETKANLKEKFTNIMKQLKIPMTMFLSYGLGIYRKPSVGLWNLLEEENGQIDKVKSFYVGDAAGRPKNWQPGAGKDHSKVDRLFALNAKINFYTPEEYFLKSSKNRFEMPLFDPNTLRNKETWGVVYEPKSARKKFTSLNELISSDQEMIIFVGFPASGKTTVARQMCELKYHAHINQDSLGSFERCLKKANDEIQAGKSVIIDNTNFLREHRKKFLTVAKLAKITARCFWFDFTLDQVRHNNKFRLLTTPDAKHKDVTDLVLYSLRKRFEQPELKEGFEQIVKMEMVPNFDNVKREKLYYMFLLEN